MMKTDTNPQTVFQALLKSLEDAKIFNRNDQVAPAVILWPDKDRHWEPLLPSLREALPQLLTLGEYDPANKTGPGIWMRCMIARTLDKADWEEEAVPILYLPGVSRQELRAVESCPNPLKPLAELQYRGVFWSQVNAKDWTLLAFLQSKEGGLGLDVSRDRHTSEAMRQAVEVLAQTSIRSLEGKRLEASDFQDLLLPDAVKDILQWLNDPTGTKNRWHGNLWKAFQDRCKADYGFDPDTDGEITGAERLGEREGNWGTVWQRFAETPQSYPNIPKLLRNAKPSGSLFPCPGAWPQDNESDEDRLRNNLIDIGETNQREAAEAIRDLDETHRGRRDWVWAALGQSPLAEALIPLKTLANQVTSGFGGSTKEDLASWYMQEGYKADEAVIDALASVKSNQDLEAVQRAIVPLYKPWLEDLAHLFQSLVKADPLPDKDDAPEGMKPDPGSCILFADGLRFDVAKKLIRILENEEMEIAESWGWAALPPVTPTAKPAVSPLCDKLSGLSEPEGFEPCIEKTGQLLNIERFRKMLGEMGIQVLQGSETGDSKRAAWTEYGNIDRAGHNEGSKLARRIDENLRGLHERIKNLSEAGWKKIHVVTDHGWLLMPGGLPKVEMPQFLVETRWGRCAILRETSKTDLPVVSWHWNSEVRLAMAPGIGCFKAGTEYAHGSISLQECVVPKLTIRSTAKVEMTVNITEVDWRGMRVRVTISEALTGLRVDLRTKAAVEDSSIVADIKTVDGEGKISLVVENEDEHPAGTAAVLVVLDEAGNILGKKSTTVGGE